MQRELTELVDRVRAAAAQRTPLHIRAGGSKDFYGNVPRTPQWLDPRSYRGIVAYEPTELVLTVRCGTPLADVERALDEQGQMLSFEPPGFGGEPTIGGTVAAGLAGPRRASSGPTYGGVRDFVLGASLLDGRAEVLRFGGTVMKNVAGYDVSRLLAGSMGTLGVILDLSIKVLPRPRAELTLHCPIPQSEALALTNRWAGQPLPVSATMWHADRLWVRLSGAQAAVQGAARRLANETGGTTLDAEEARALWRSVRDQQHPFFGSDGQAGQPLWRVSLPSTAAPLARTEPQLVEWNGALRWFHSNAAATAIRAEAQRLGGHATLFRGGDAQQRDAGVFTPLSAPLAAIHRRLKAEFDPAGIFNPGRMYADF